MKVEVFPSGPLATNAYVVSCRETKIAAIIDPAATSAYPIQQYVEENELKIKKNILTHSHWDHIADTFELKNKYNAKVFIHKEDVKNLENPGSDGLPLLFSIKGVIPDGYLEDGKKVVVGNVSFVVIHTPGHSPGGVCLYDKDNGVLFSGDTLFKGSIGNTQLPTANANDLFNSLDILQKLPKETKVYPGHGESTTLKDENWLERAREIFN